MAARTMDVERLLHWAYRDELPKAPEWGGGEDGGSILSRLAEYGGPVDNWARDPGYPLAMGQCHPDALIVAQAAEGLPSVALDGPAIKAELAPEFMALVADDDVTLLRLHVEVAAYVVMHARMGTRPDWAGPSRLLPMDLRNGRAKVVGLSSNRSYKEGAHCPCVVDPDPREAMADRAIYVAWHAALESLAATLRESVSYAEVTGPEAPARPWLVNDPQPVILEDLKETATFRRMPRSHPRRVA